VIEKHRESLLDLKDCISWGIPSKSDKDNVVSFIKGFIRGSQANIELLILIGIYLKEQYGINNDFNNWIAQIDHYAYLNDKDWFMGINKLLRELYEYEGDLLLPEKKEVSDEFVEFEHSTEFVDYLNLDHEIKIKIGDVLKIGNKEGEVYKQTKYYDNSIRNPDWSLFYSSKNDFNRIQFYNECEKMYPATFGKVWRIFSDFTTKIKKIIKKDDRWFAYTDLFEIDIKNALTRNEVELVNNQFINKKNIAFEKDLKEQIDNYRIGLLGEDFNGIESLVRYRLSLMFLDLDKKWQQNIKNIKGDWYKKN